MITYRKKLDKIKQWSNCKCMFM